MGLACCTNDRVPRAWTVQLPLPQFLELNRWWGCLPTILDKPGVCKCGEVQTTLPCSALSSVQSVRSAAAQAVPHLLSSSTELRDSIHSGSTSPSQMIQDCCCRGSLATALAAAVRIPSDHSRVSASMCPAAHPCLLDAGRCCQAAIRPDAIRQVSHFSKNVICSASMPLRHWKLLSSCQQTRSCGSAYNCLQDSTAVWQCQFQRRGRPMPASLRPCAQQDPQCNVGALRD